MAVVVLALGLRFSINYAVEAHVEEAPLDYASELEILPNHDEGPITITIDYLMANDDRETACSGGAVRPSPEWRI